ncbi:hypothetical protein G9A89_012031 [Geosiphon pyriformis]|nr:hypothetical protein G9A89_012031 [Geosiphon pyriformis]
MKDTSAPKELVPSSRKGINRYKFQSFTARVNDIKIDVSLKSYKVVEEPQDGTSFKESLGSWKELNLTANFVAFSREISKYCQTLPQVLYHKEQIVDILKKYLSIKDSMALEPLLDLTTKLARDLGEEFFPYFELIFQAILPLTKSRDASVLEVKKIFQRYCEWTFNCIAYLFKYLYKNIIENLDTTYKLIAPLLGKDYIPSVRKFAAQAFGYLLRRVGESPLTIIDCIIESLKANPELEYCDGISILFYEGIKTINNGLHSKGLSLYTKILHKLYDDVIVNTGDFESNITYFAVKQTTIALVQHCSQEHLTSFLNLFLEELENDIFHIKGVPNSDISFTVMKIAVKLSMVHLCITVGNGASLGELRPVFAMMYKVAPLIATSSLETAHVSRQYLKLSTSLLTLKRLNDVGKTDQNILLSKIFENPDVQAVLSFTLGLAKLNWINFTSSMLPHIVAYASQHWITCPEKITLFLASLITSGAVNLESTFTYLITEQKKICSSKQRSQSRTWNIPKQVLRILDDTNIDWILAAHDLSKIDLNKGSDQVSQICLYATALTTIPYVELPFVSTQKILVALINRLIEILKSSESTFFSPLLKRPLTNGSPLVLLQYLLGLSVESLTLLCKRAGDKGLNIMVDLWDNIIDRILLQYPCNEVILRASATYMNFIHSNLATTELFDHPYLEKIYSVLKTNINSFRHNQRLYTLQILSLFQQFPLEAESSKTQGVPESCKIFSLALATERCPITMDSFREKLLYLQKFTRLISSGRVPNFYAEVAPRFCLGLFTIQYSPLWTEAIKTLATLSRIDPSTTWSIIYSELARFDDQVHLARDGFSFQSLSYFFQSDGEFSENLATKGLSFDCLHLKAFNKSFEEAELFFGHNFKTSLIKHFIAVCSPENARYDHWNYYRQLIRTLIEIPGLAGKNTSQLFLLFKKISSADFDETFKQEDIEVTQLIKTEDNNILTQSNNNTMDLDGKEEEISVLEISPNLLRSNLILFLELFAKLPKPHNQEKQKQLREVYLRLLTNGDSKIQSLALNCLLAWKLNNIIPYAENLKNLVDDDKYRDELVSFSLVENGPIQPAHRIDIMPLVIRILYGRLISRKGNFSSKSAMSARRTAMLSVLNNYPPGELKLFIQLILEPFTEIRKLPSIENGTFSFVENFNLEQSVSFRKQFGFLNLLADAFTQFGSKLSFFINDLFKVVLYIVHEANQKLSLAEMEHLTDDSQNDHKLLQSFKGHIQHLRSLRQLGLKRIVDFFQLPEPHNFQPYVRAMFKSFISQRIPKFSVENTQASSTLMELFLTWATRKEYIIFLVDYNKEVLPKIFGCLSAKKVQKSVFSSVLDIIDDIIKICDIEPNHQADNPDSLTNKVLVANLSPLLENLENMLLKTNKDGISFYKDAFARRVIGILSHVAAYVVDGEQAIKLIELILPSLRKPAHLVPEKTKFDILCIIMNFLNIIPGFTLGSDLFMRYYTYICELFLVFGSRECRKILTSVLDQFAHVDGSLEEIVKIIVGLNSYSLRQLDEPDFERRISMFDKIRDSINNLTFNQWLPVLYNCLYFIQDIEEASIRSNAGHCIKLFIACCAKSYEKNDPDHDRLFDLLIKVVYPEIKKGMHSKAEAVRIEYINLLSFAVTNCSKSPQFKHMTSLLSNDDEEANFFKNIHHIQIHRRIRALSRFSDQCAAGEFRNCDLIQIFLPLIGHFIFEADKKTDHHLVNQAIMTIGVIASQLSWGPYYNLLKQYFRLISRKSGIEKILVRLIISIIDNFHFDISAVQVNEDIPVEVKENHLLIDADLSSVDIDSYTPQVMEEDIKDIETPQKNNLTEEFEMESSLTAQSPEDSAKKIHHILVKTLIPELKQFLIKGDKDDLNVRVPVALAITKLLKTLPEASLRLSLPGLLTSVCQILRNRQQDARDTTRKTLKEISSFLGPLYFSFILKELQAALTKGYQLHVLGYTVHSLLVDMLPNVQFGEIDYCAAEITEIMINDIFGHVGQEKENEGITGKMKEMKSSKSYDSFELMATKIELKNISVLLLPLKEILKGTQIHKVLENVKEVLRRIAKGINQNENFEADQMLSLCQGLISQNLEFYKSDKKSKDKQSNLEKNYTVQSIHDKSENSIDYFSTNAHIFVTFGLTIFFTSLKREKFDKKSPQQIELLDSFVDIVSDALYSRHNDITLSAIRIMCLLCKIPLPSMEKAFPALVEQLFALLHSSNGTKSVLVQTCFQLLSILIRDCEKVRIKESELTYVINLIRPDLEEPERQTITFSLIRAIISRKFVVSEVYDLMDSVRNIMLTSQAAQIREQCRLVLFQFLLDYPQNRKQMKNAMNFLIKNLEYTYESGKLSVMEMLNSIFLKFPSEMLKEYILTLFLYLIKLCWNDESSKVKKTAAELIKNVLARMDSENLEKVSQLMNSWYEQDDKFNLKKMAIQAYGFVIEAFGQQISQFVPQILDRLEAILLNSTNDIKAIQEANGEEMELDFDWELPFVALSTLDKLLKNLESPYSTRMSSLWNLVEQHLLYPHTWIRTVSSRLFGIYFSDINPESYTTHALDQDLPTVEVLRNWAANFAAQLKSCNLTSELSLQISKNLYFIAKCFYYLPPSLDVGKDEGTKREGEQVEADQGVCRKTSLMWLFNKMSFQARKVTERSTASILQREAIFRLFAAMARLIPKGGQSLNYLVLVISPIYRLVNDDTWRGDDVEPLKKLGQEVLDLVEKGVGNAEYNRAYLQVRQQVAEVRKERKAQQAVRAIVDPAAAAGRKRHKEDKGESRKRREL